MRIFQGVRALEEIAPLLDAGANELYTGFHDEQRFPLKNHYEREFGLEGIDALMRALDLVHARGSRLFLALNQSALPGAEAERHANALLELDACGVDGFIVASLPLLLCLSQRTLRAEVCLSTLQPCFNQRALGFFRSLGLRRVVLPEHMTGDEARAMVDCGVDLEVMFWPTHDCCNVEAWCIFHHDSEKYLQIRPGQNFAYCSAVSRFAGDGDHAPRLGLEIVREEVPREGRFLINGFGNLWEHHRAGVKWLKMGNRPHRLLHKLALLDAARRLLDLLDGGFPDRTTFVGTGTTVLRERLAAVGLASPGEPFIGVMSPVPHRERRGWR